MMSNSQISTDSTSIDPYLWDKQIWSSYAEDKVYQYKNPEPLLRNAWDQLQEYLWGWLSRSNINVTSWVEDILTLIALSLFIFTVIYIIRRRRSAQAIDRSLSADSPKLQSHVLEWNATYIQEQLEKAKEEKNWNEAIRWLYHEILVQLDRKKLIQQSFYKTAYDYQKSLLSQPFYSAFMKLQTAHLRAWYDEVTMSQTDFDLAVKAASSIEKHVNEAV